MAEVRAGVTGAAGTGDGTGVLVRPMTATDLPAAVRLHRAEMGAQFLSRFGPRFLHAYYRAFLDDPNALALVGVDAESAALLGILLGATCPAAHYRQMVRRHGLALAGRLLLASVAHPALGAELVRTRTLRYARGLLRLALTRWRPAAAGQPATATGPAARDRAAEITIVAVEARARRRGAGRALLGEAASRARAAGAARLELVTPEEDPNAARFYARIGWRVSGRAASRSGERFVRFELPLGGGPANLVGAADQPPGG